MAFSEHLAARTRTTLKGVKGVAERQMFGGLAYPVRGHMGRGIVGDELRVRVGPDNYTACLAQPHAREMDLTGYGMKGMVYVPARGSVKICNFNRGWLADSSSSPPCPRSRTREVSK